MRRNGNKYASDDTRMSPDQGGGCVIAARNRRGSLRDNAELFCMQLNLIIYHRVWEHLHMTYNNTHQRYDTLRELLDAKHGLDAPPVWLYSILVGQASQSQVVDKALTRLVNELTAGGYDVVAEYKKSCEDYKTAKKVEAAKAVSPVTEQGTYQRSDETKEKLAESMVGNKNNNNDKKVSIVDKSKNINYTDSPSTRSDKGGTSKTYRIAKLKRDHPDIAQRLIDGEFKNVREAERAAGLPVPAKKTKVELAVAAYQRLSPDEQSQFHCLIAGGD